MDGWKESSLPLQKLLLLPVPARDFCRERVGTALNFTHPVLLTFSKVLFGFTAWTLNRRLLGTPRLLFRQCVFLAEDYSHAQYIRRSNVFIFSSAISLPEGGKHFLVGLFFP